MEPTQKHNWRTPIRVLLIIAIAALVLLVGIAAQSTVRYKQKQAVLREIFIETEAAQGNKDLIGAVLIRHKDDVQFLQDHQPILNVRLQALPASADDAAFYAALDNFCAQYIDILLNAEYYAYTWGGNASAMRSIALNVMAAVGCAL